jgi:hypothetical protein
MGHSTLIDIIGSATTFGLLLLAALRLNASTSESNYAYNQSYLLQRNMVVLTVMLEDDLKHVGAGVLEAGGGVQHADVSDLSFKAALTPGSTPVLVEWKLESTAPPYSQNPNIRYLSRSINGVKQNLNLGVTKFEIHYWRVDNPNIEISPPINFAPNPNPCGNIGPISVGIRLESYFRLKREYMEWNDTSSYVMVWRQIRSISRNNSIQFPS